MSSRPSVCLGRLCWRPAFSETRTLFITSLSILISFVKWEQYSLLTGMPCGPSGIVSGKMMPIVRVDGLITEPLQLLLLLLILLLLIHNLSPAAIFL